MLGGGRYVKQDRLFKISLSFHHPIVLIIKCFQSKLYGIINRSGILPRNFDAIPLVFRFRHSEDRIHA